MLAKSLLLLTTVLLLAGCATQRIPFNESEYSGRPSSGDKLLTGQIFLVDQLAMKQVGSGSEITLEPVTSYSNQWFEASYQKNLPLTKPDPRYNQYVLKTRADKGGNFTFEKIPAGEYYLSGVVKWLAATCSGKVVSKKIPVSQKITVPAEANRTEVPLTKPFTSPSSICDTYSQGDWTKE